MNQRIGLLREVIVDAIRKGDIKSLRVHLKCVPNVNFVLPQRKNRPARESALMLAAECGFAVGARHLISLGANVNQTNEYRQPSLLYAVRGNQVATVNLLLKSGADPNLVMVDGDFLLSAAATTSIDIRICRALIKHGADPCMVSKNGTTALHTAAFHGRADLAKLLIRAGADTNLRDKHGFGPLSCAISRHHRDVAVLLLKSGADPQLQPEALGVAAWEGNREFVEQLIERGWNVHSRAHQGRTPLQHARNRRHKTVVDVLINAGAR